jgi:DNA-directed RNA polymerase specialized sigma24 family protein
VMVTLEALREAKKQSGDKVVVDEETARSAEEQRIRWTTLQASLSQLPETRRRAVALHLSGLAPLEIADLLQWSEAKTRKQIERGLQILRTKLQAAGIEYEID